MSDRRDFDVEHLSRVSGLSRFDLVNVVRARANDLDAGAQARVPLARQKPVSLAMREISRGRLGLKPPPKPRAHVLDANTRICAGCGWGEEAIVEGRAPGRCLG